MIQEFQVQNFYSIRERQTISFVPTNDDRMRDQYVHEVSDGVELLKIGIVISVARCLTNRNPKMKA